MRRGLGELRTRNESTYHLISLSSTTSASQVNIPFVCMLHDAHVNESTLKFGVLGFSYMGYVCYMLGKCPPSQVARQATKCVAASRIASDLWTTVFMLVVHLWQPTVCKLEKGLITLQQSNCYCSRMLSDPSSLLLTYHAATDKLSSKKDY